MKREKRREERRKRHSQTDMWQPDVVQPAGKQTGNTIVVLVFKTLLQWTYDGSVGHVPCTG